MTENRHGVGGGPRVTGRPAECLVFTPTYNEKGNIEPLVGALLSVDPPCDVLVVDDQSTDGTTEALMSLAAVEPRLDVIVRPGKLGIGSAHKLAWLYARQHGYARIVTLDADLSHDARDVPRLLAALDAGADVVIGSRFMPGGSLEYRGWRRFLSRNANRGTRMLLRLPLTEYTNSLRAAKLDRVPAGLVESVEHDGYGFFLACAVRMARQGLQLAEIPIHFGERGAGASKIPRLEIVRGAINLVKLAGERERPRWGETLLPAWDQCPNCGGPYRVAGGTGERRCLACLGRASPAGPS